MNTNTKILILFILFGLRAVLYFLYGISSLLNAAPYAEYGDTFVQAGIMAYLAYVVKYQRTKWTYWVIVLFVGLDVVRFLFGSGIIVLFADEIRSLSLILLATLNTLVFAVIPLFILFQKDMRNLFLRTSNGPLTPSNTTLPPR